MKDSVETTADLELIDNAAEALYNAGKSCQTTIKWHHLSNIDKDLWSDAARHGLEYASRKLRV